MDMHTLFSLSLSPMTVLSRLAAFNNTVRGTEGATQLVPLSAILITFVFLTSMKASAKLISPETRETRAGGFDGALILSVYKGERGLLFETKSLKLQRVITSLQNFLIVARASADIRGFNGRNTRHRLPLAKHRSYLNSHLLE